MNISKDQIKKIMSKEDEDILSVMQLPIGLALNMVLKVTMELGIFDLLAKSGPNAQLSSSQIASKIPTKNPQAPLMIEKILSFLASQSLLRFTLSKEDESGPFYSLTPLSRNLVSNEDGVSIAPTFLFINDQAIVNSWFYLKDAILEGEIPFNKAHGMGVFEYHEKESRYAGVYNKSTQNINKITIDRILESYNGFDQDVKQIIDVGGALGLTMASIVSKYPHIRGINFDLPHVIKDAPVYPGVEHVSGDMFQSVPQGDVIFMKHVLHDWDDDDCIKILKNCWKSLPNSGKVVLVEHIKPEHPETDDLFSKNAFFLDVFMMIATPGGKERTKEEFATIAKKSGFACFKVINSAFLIWIMELYKQ